MANDELMIADQPGDKYGDVFLPGGGHGGWGGGGYGGGGGQPYGGGGGGIPNPFIPGFAGGQAQGWGGFGAQTPWGGGGGMQRRRLMQGSRGPFGMQQGRMEGNGGQMMGGGAGPQGGGNSGWGGLLAQFPSLGAFGGRTAPQGFSGGGGSGQWKPGNAHETVGDILGGGQATMGMNGGAFGLNPPPAIMAAIRGQAVQDAGARERSARMGLQARMGRGEGDASNFGFQALMSQLGGQDQTARTMSQADLGMRQQQLQFLQQLMGQWMGNNTALEGQNRQSRAEWEAGGGRSGWGDVGGMVGQGAAAYFGGGVGGVDGGGGGGGAQPPRMGQAGYQYPRG